MRIKSPFLCLEFSRTLSHPGKIAVPLPPDNIRPNATSFFFRCDENYDLGIISKRDLQLPLLRDVDLEIIDVYTWMQIKDFIVTLKPEFRITPRLHWKKLFRYVKLKCLARTIFSWHYQVSFLYSYQVYMHMRKQNLDLAQPNITKHLLVDSISSKLFSHVSNFHLDRKIPFSV